LAALQAIDAGPFADIVAIGGTAIEKVLLDARHERRLRTVLFPIRVRGRKAHIKACLGKEPFLDADDHRQAQHRVVRRNFDDRSMLFGLHGLSCLDNLSGRSSEEPWAKLNTWGHLSQSLVLE